MIISLENLLFGTMSGTSLEHVWTMFGLALLLVYLLHCLLVCWFSHPLVQVLHWWSYQPLVLLLVKIIIFKVLEVQILFQVKLPTLSKLFKSSVLLLNIWPVVNCTIWVYHQFQFSNF